MIKNKNPGGFIDHQSKGLGVGEEDNRWSLFFFLTLFACSLHTRRCFQKERKEKKHNVCVQATILVTFVETLFTLCHLQNWFMYYGFANKQGSQCFGEEEKK